MTASLLWLDREPFDAGPAVGWHLNVDVGDGLRFAGTWAEASLLYAPDHDPEGVEGLAAVLGIVAAEAEAVCTRSVAAIAGRADLTSGTGGAVMVMGAVLLVLSAGLAVAVLVVAAWAWRHQGRLSPVAVGCVLLCLTNLTVVAVTVAGPS